MKHLPTFAGLLTLALAAGLVALSHGAAPSKQSDTFRTGPGAVGSATLTLGVHDALTAEARLVLSPPVQRTQDGPHERAVALSVQFRDGEHRTVAETLAMEMVPAHGSHTIVRRFAHVDAAAHDETLEAFVAPRRYEVRLTPLPGLVWAQVRGPGDCTLEVSAQPTGAR